MEIRDPIHGSISIKDEFIPVIKGPFFDRLRYIKQLGFSEFAFPGATHTRFIHSIGVMNIAEKAFNTLFFGRLGNKETLKLKYTFMAAASLHDIGHAPLSHATESVMPMASSLELPKRYMPKAGDRQASHEDYTIKIVSDSDFTKTLDKLSQNYDVDPFAICDLITGFNKSENYFHIDGVDYFPLLHQLISSEMDCDRMDYLLRDSYFCGVSYGGFDLDWILANLDICIENDKAYLAISERTVVTFDDFLLSRFHMFVMVYFHYKPVCMEKLLYRYFGEESNEYTIPSDVNAYLKHNDHYLWDILRKSDSDNAKRLTNCDIPQKIFESFNLGQKNQLESIQTFLTNERIDYIRCSSSGRLSKYYKNDQVETPYFPLRVVRKVFDKRAYFDISEATDLFEKFSKANEINRLHCRLENLPSATRKEIIRLCQEGL